MNYLKTILHALSSQPKTTEELVAELHSSQSAVAGMLVTLERGGLIQQAIPPSGAGCGVCNLKSMCRVAEQNPDELKLHLYRLTARGIAVLG